MNAQSNDAAASVGAIKRYADEEVPSSNGYISGYIKPKSIPEQVSMLLKLFPGLQGECDMTLYGELPEGPEGYFVIPHWLKIAPTYGQAVQKVLDLLSKAYNGHFKNSREGELGPKNLRQSGKSAVVWEKFGQEQKVGVLVVPAQFGLRHRGRSVRRAREVMESNEFGLGAFAVGIMLLTHPERLMDYDDLHIDCAGDEYAPETASEFSFAPYFRFRDGGLEFGMEWSNLAFALYGSASGWSAPQ